MYLAMSFPGGQGHTDPSSVSLGEHTQVIARFNIASVDVLHTKHVLLDG